MISCDNLCVFCSFNNSSCILSDCFLHMLSIANELRTAGAVFELVFGCIEAAADDVHVDHA